MYTLGTILANKKAPLRRGVILDFTTGYFLLYRHLMIIFSIFTAEPQRLIYKNDAFPWILAVFTVKFSLNWLTDVRLTTNPRESKKAIE